MALTAQQLMALKQALMQKQGMPQGMPAPTSQRAMPPVMTKQPSHPVAAPGAYGYDQGGAVDPKDVQDALAAYMPSDAEAAASGFPPGPQRKTYIAQQRKNAADAQSIAKDSGQPVPAGYKDGGEVDDAGKYTTKTAERGAALARGAGYKDASAVPLSRIKTGTLPAGTPDYTDAEDAAEAAEEMTKANPPKNVDINGNAWSQGGQIGNVSADKLADLLEQSGYPAQAKEIRTGSRTPYSNEQYDKETSKQNSDSDAKGFDEGGEAEATEADATPAAADEAPLQTSMAEALASKDPQALKKMLEATRQSSQETSYDAAKDAAQTAKLDKAVAKDTKKDPTKKEAVEEAVEDAAKGAVPKDALASTEDSKSTSIPGMPGKYMKGQDIVSQTDSDPTDDLSDLTGPNSSSMPQKNALSDMLSGAAAPSAAPTNPVLAQLLAKRAAMGGAAPAPASSPSQATTPQTSPVAAANIAPQNDIGALLDKLGVGSSADTRLAQLQAQKQKMMQSNALQMGGDTISRAFARGRGAQMAPNTEYYNQMNAMANAPIEAEMQRRAIVKDAMDTGVKTSDFMDKQQTRDPSSPVSGAFRSMALTWNPDLKDAPGFDKMDAEGIKQMLPGIDMQVKRDYMIQDTKLRAQQMAMVNQDRQDRQTSDKQNAAEMRLGNQLTQMNSLRGANGQSQKNGQLADRILDLAKNYDPNDPKSVANSRIILNETMGMLAQAANGGIAHEGQVDRIYPNNISDNLSKLQSYITSAPAGYDIKPFLDQAVNQAKIFKQVGQNYEKKNNAMQLYGAKNAVRPEVYEHYKNQLDLDDSDINNAYNRTEDVTKSAKASDNKVGTVMMRDPQGNIRPIPQGQVPDALKAGGTLVGQ